MEFETSCRRLATVDLRNLRYDSGAVTRGCHARRLRYKIMSAPRANGFNLVAFCFFLFFSVRHNEVHKYETTVLGNG